MSDWIQDRMLGYYPEVIKDIYDIQAIVDGEYPEFKLLNEEYIESVQNNAYLLMMDESRIAQWEELLDIKILPDSSIEDRRETIIARIRGTNKLNTELINKIVNSFTKGIAISRVENSVLYVDILLPNNYKEYKFPNVETELRKRVPAHLGISVNRKYWTWGDVKYNFETWRHVNDLFDDWEDVKTYMPDLFYQNEYIVKGGL